MKLFNVNDVKGFFKTVEQCDGNVFLVTSEGDRLNLKSTLSQYVSIAELFAAGRKVPEIELYCSEPDDYTRLITYMMNEKDETLN